MVCAQGQWTVLQGAEDTELLRKDAVHHLVKARTCQRIHLLALALTNQHS